MLFFSEVLGTVEKQLLVNCMTQGLVEDTFLGLWQDFHKPRLLVFANDIFLG
jgi:hypothetical protein